MSWLAWWGALPVDQSQVDWSPPADPGVPGFARLSLGRGGIQACSRAGPGAGRNTGLAQQTVEPSSQPLEQPFERTSRPDLFTVDELVVGTGTLGPGRAKPGGPTAQRTAGERGAGAARTDGHGTRGGLDALGEGARLPELVLEQCRRLGRGRLGSHVLLLDYGRDDLEGARTPRAVSGAVRRHRDWLHQELREHPARARRRPPREVHDDLLARELGA